RWTSRLLQYSSRGSERFQVGAQLGGGARNCYGLANCVYSLGPEFGSESTAHPRLRPEHDSLLQRILERFVANEILFHFYLWAGLDTGNASCGEERQAD